MEGERIEWQRKERGEDISDSGGEGRWGRVEEEEAEGGPDGGGGRGRGGRDLSRLGGGEGGKALSRGGGGRGNMSRTAEKEAEGGGGGYRRMRQRENAPLDRQTMEEGEAEVGGGQIVGLWRRGRQRRKQAKQLDCGGGGGGSNC